MKYSKITLATATGINEALSNLVAYDVMELYDAIEDSDTGAELKDKLIELRKARKIFAEPTALRITDSYCRVQFKDNFENILYLKIIF